MSTNKKIAVVVLCFVMFATAHRHTQAQTYTPGYKAVRSGSYVRDKNFYLLTLFSQLPRVNAVISNDSTFKSLLLQKTAALKKAASECKENPGCHVAALRWTASDMDRVSSELIKLYHQRAAIKELVNQHLLPSGYYVKYESLKPDSLLSSAWKDIAKAINRIMDVYALGIKPKYAVLDSASYDVNTLVYRQNINIVVNTLDDLAANDVQQFYDPALHFSLDLLEINMRNEADRFEPNEQVNASAIKYLKTIQWHKYPYAAILVPGAGPDITSARIDPWAISRLRIAVARYKKGLAPVFIVSGGFVKPFQPPYAEGNEMKRYLIEHMGIPAEAIILEPYARHTTTNIRNASRLIYRYRIPAQKKALIISDQYQTHTIQSDKFRQRCLDELGYLPFTFLAGKGKTDTEFVPALTSLHLDALDPLDP